MYRTTLLAGAIALAFVSGCHLYFEGDRDGNTYCDQTGCYYCDDFGCYPEDGGEDWACEDNYDCAAGCYCDNGVCEEAGFCTYDSDCPSGFVCDDRSSCVPEDSDSGDCTADSDCPEASFCDEGSGQCIGSWSCTSDDQCSTGYTCDEERKTCIPEPCESDLDCQEGCYCDENSGQCVETSTCGPEGECAEGLECDSDRNTCVPADPNPATCQGEVTCAEAPPFCPDGTNPGIADGCYTGECIADAECPDGAPVYCEDHADENTCLADDSCDAVYRGLNCTDPNGQSCTSDQANCTCESFVFHECVASP